MAISTLTYVETIAGHPYAYESVNFVFPIKNNLYAAIDYSGTISATQWLTSTDGKSFTPSGVVYQDTPNTSSYYPTEYVAVLDGYLVFGRRTAGNTSTFTHFNGSSTQETVAPAGSALNCGLAANSSTVLGVTDLNGYEFTLSTGPGNATLSGPTGLPNYRWINVEHFNGTFYAIGYNDNNPGVAKSTDGVNWTYDPSFWPLATYGGIFAVSDSYLALSSYSGENNKIYVWDGSAMFSSTVPTELNAGSDQMNMFYNPHGDYFVVINEDAGLVAATEDFQTYSQSATVPGGVNGGSSGYGVSDGFIVYGTNGAIYFQTAVQPPPVLVSGSDFWDIKTSKGLSFKKTLTS